MGKFKADAGRAPLEILRLSREYAGELELLCIGALTNVAVALRLDPSLSERVARITLMGGYCSESIPEWNILCDPEAAHIVLCSGIPVRMVGLDVCLQCKMPAEMFDRLCGGGEFYVRLIKKWKEYYGYELPILYDPLAAATLFSDCVRFTERRMKVCLQGELRGVMYTAPDGCPVHVAEEVDVPAFFRLFAQNNKNLF